MEINDESQSLTTISMTGTENGTASAEGDSLPTESTSPSTTEPEDPVDGSTLRQGSISSARFNILCTMVGGGCLSLPMAFQKTGNGFLGPFVLVVTAAITEYCFRIIIAATRRLSPVRESTTVIGKDSFETMASAAFGSQGFLFAKWLVTAMCFFGAVGYAVLLRDMLAPITDAITHHNHHHNATLGSWWVNEWGVEEGSEGGGGPTLASNLTMLTVILIITPVCTLKNLSSLEKLGAASMSSILILGAVIVFRSLQCNLGHPHESFDGHVWPAFKLWPDSAKDVLDAFPLFVSCYVCHYNIPIVHNELQNPSPKRVNYWLRSTTVAASVFYMTVGLAGSAYGHCTPTGKVQGNVLLDFDEDDPLLLVARMCLACTITLAFPLLVIPARDILLRSWFSPPTTPDCHTTTESSLREPLLDAINEENADPQEEAQEGSDTVTTPATPTPPAPSQPQQHSYALRLGLSVLVLWSATAVACCVKSIDVVWDLLGSSLSILLSYLIPAACFICIVGESTENQTDYEEDEDSRDTDTGNIRWRREMALKIAKGMILVYVPMMFISTANACYGTFLS
jgi:amino acid permease